MPNITAVASNSDGTFSKTLVESKPLGPFELFIDILACGFCYTDTYPMAKHGYVGGHEIAGTIREIGSMVHNLKVGDTVGFGYQRSACLSCEQCNQGHDILCPDLKTFSDGMGGFATGTVWDSRFVFKIPPQLEPKNAAPLMCAGATVFSVLYGNNVSPTARIGIVGIGGLGHLGLQFARAWGCHVVAISTSPSKEAEAKSFGAHEFWDSSKFAEGEMEGYEKLDFILNTVSGDLPWGLYLSLLKPSGKLVLCGVPHSPISATATPFILKQAMLTGSLVASRNVQSKMLEFAARHGIRPVIQEFPFSESGAADALKRVKENKVRYRAVFVMPTSDQ